MLSVANAVRKQSMHARYNVASGFALRFGVFSLALAPAALADFDLRAVLSFSFFLAFVLLVLRVFAFLIRAFLAVAMRPPAKRLLRRLARLPAITLSPRLLPIPLRA